jgi:hypothetical protein
MNSTDFIYVVSSKNGIISEIIPIKKEEELLESLSQAQDIFLDKIFSFPEFQTIDQNLIQDILEKGFFSTGDFTVQIFVT